MSKTYRKQLAQQIAVLMLTIALFCSSCRGSRRTVAVQTADRGASRQTETVRRTDSVTVYRHDSVFFERAADTVRVERFRTLFRDRWHTDTLVLIRTDTVLRTTAETVTLTHVEYRTHTWQRVLMWAGGISITLGALLALSAVFMKR